MEDSASSVGVLFRWKALHNDPHGCPLELCLPLGPGHEVSAEGKEKSAEYLSLLEKPHRSELAQSDKGWWGAQVRCGYLEARSLPVNYYHLCLLGLSQAEEQ